MNHYWGGAGHPIPMNYKLPSWCALEHWKLYHFGNPSIGVGPHMLLINKRDIVLKKDKVQMTRIRTIMEKLIEIASQAVPVLLPVNLSNCDQVFDYSYNILLMQLYPKGYPRSKNDININTLYERYRRYCSK